jgi:nicotinamidase-related amidase
MHAWSVLTGTRHQDGFVWLHQVSAIVSLPLTARVQRQEVVPVADCQTTALKARMMKQVLLIVDLQEAFQPPAWLVERIRDIARFVPAIASIELHDETNTPFAAQLGWCPPIHDECLVKADRVFVKNGYKQSAEAIQYLKREAPARVLVCGVQTDTCVLAAGFDLFDAGLRPTLVTDLTVGSSLDRSGDLGIRLWRHHFGNTTTSPQITI